MDREQIEFMKDEMLVEFTKGEMRLKLADSRAKGRGGWWNPEWCSRTHLQDLLKEHVAKSGPGNYMDIAILAAMLHYRNRFDASGYPQPPQ